MVGIFNIFQKPLSEQDGIFDAEPQIGDLPLALKINLWTPVALFYEKLWRWHSISILSFGRYSTKQELDLMIQLLQLQSGQRILDAGCSAGLYSRRILSAKADVEVHAVDFSHPFLKEAKRISTRDGIRISFTRADLQDLPYRDNTFNIVACGGTPNEWRNPRIVLQEFSRILKTDGCLWVMYLSKASSAVGKLLQSLISTAGIRFFDHNELNKIAKEFNLKPVATNQYGVVTMTLFRIG